MPSPITVFIVDDDKSVQRALARLMKAARIHAFCLDSIEELLERDLPASDAVIIADERTARQFGETLPHQLHKQGPCLPVIYLTDSDSEWTRNEAKKIGAAGYFRKPVDEQALFDAISFSVQKS